MFDRRNYYISNKFNYSCSSPKRVAVKKQCKLTQDETRFSYAYLRVCEREKEKTMEGCMQVAPKVMRLIYFHGKYNIYKRHNDTTWLSNSLLQNTISLHSYHHFLYIFTSNVEEPTCWTCKNLYGHPPHCPVSVNVQSIQNIIWTPWYLRISRQKNLDTFSYGQIPRSWWFSGLQMENINSIGSFGFPLKSMFLTQSFWVYLNISKSLAKKEMEPGKTKKVFKNTVKMNW